jgi:hypothetical protein
MSSEELSLLSLLATPKPEPMPLNNSHIDSLIESAIQGQAGTRDAMRWLVRQLTTTQEPMTEHQRWNLVMDHLGPVALAGGQMSLLDAFTLGIEATERHHGITKEQA